MTNSEGYRDPTAERAIGEARKKKPNPRKRLVYAICDLIDFWEKGKANERIRNPEAWALHQTWKKYNGGQGNG